MRSGTTQRKHGSWGLSSQTPVHAGQTPVLAGEVLAGERLVAGRLASILVGAGALGVVFALFPLRAHAATRMDILPIALVLLAQGLAYAAAVLGSDRLRGFAPLITLLCVPLILLSKVEPLAVAAFAALAGLASALDVVLLRGAKALVLPLCALMVPSLVALVVIAPHFGIIAAAVVVVVAPLVSALMPLRETAAPQALATVAPRENAWSALLLAALAPEGRMLLVSDAMGLIDAALCPQGAEAEQAFPGGSLTEATLIADRVALLHMLAQAAREGRETGSVILRLRRGPLGAGYPAPGHFEPCRLRAFPLPDMAGRAGILIEPELREPSRQSVAPVAVATPNAALLARALHDSLAPFNAGLGFLEMVADPRMAPRDFTALHDFTAEAHKAMCEAHRNSVLMGTWMRISQDEAFASTRSETGARRLFTEATRLLNLEDMEKRGDLVAQASLDTGQSYTLPLNAARFALAVLLRYGLGAAHVDVELRHEGEDLVFTVMRRQGGESAEAADAFQQVLEQAAMTGGSAAGGNFMFEAAGQGARTLRLHAVAATRRASDALRLAS